MTKIRILSVIIGLNDLPILYNSKTLNCGRIFTKNRFTSRYTLSLPIEQSRFVHLLDNAVDSDEFQFFEVFSPNQNKFKGQVDMTGFNIRRRRTFFNGKRVFSRAKGIFRSENNKLQAAS